MSETAQIITAVAGVLTPLGAGFAWLWRRIEKRFAAVEMKLVECEKREAGQKERSGKHLIVIELLWQEVSRRSRGASPVLDRCGKLLDDLKEKEDGK